MSKLSNMFGHPFLKSWEGEIVSRQCMNLAKKRNP